MYTLLKAAGYRTGLIGKLHVNPGSAFPVDFQRIQSANFGRRKVEEYAKAAAEFFNDSKDEPFFLSINYPDAHLPFHRQQFGRPEHPLRDAAEVIANSESPPVTSCLRGARWSDCEAPLIFRLMLHYAPPSRSFRQQHFLYFLPLPQGHGSLRPARPAAAATRVGSRKDQLGV